MIDSRDLNELHPVVQAKARLMIERCKAAGINLLVTSTYRDNACQTMLYARGRTTKGTVVTNAKAGQSYHNYRLAFDVVPLIGGKPLWSTSISDMDVWQNVGRIGKSCGLEWAGDWTHFREYPHFQATGGLTLTDLQAGKKPFEGKA